MSEAQADLELEQARVEALADLRRRMAQRTLHISRLSSMMAERAVAVEKVKGVVLLDLQWLALAAGVEALHMRQRFDGRAIVELEGEGNR